MRAKICLSILLVLCVTGISQAVMYQGQLTYTPPAPIDPADELNVVGGPADGWTTYTVNFYWTVSDTDNSFPGYPWKYEYRLQLSGTKYGYSHIIVESSEGMTADDIRGLSGALLDSVKLQTVLGGNPDMPEDVYGIRFNPFTGGITDLSWSFFSNRQPVWGDFYGRCGGQGGINQAFNYNLDSLGIARGFLDPDGINTNRDDTDPTAPAANGSFEFHILRPDTVIPEPATLLLLCLGIPISRRFTKKS